jgi:hypothetical protein
MVEPYDVPNLSLLPVFDSSKEEIIPIWKELVERVGLEIRMNETVEHVQPNPGGLFEIRTNVAAIARSAWCWRPACAASRARSASTARTCPR